MPKKSSPDRAVALRQHTELAPVEAGDVLVTVAGRGVVNVGAGYVWGDTGEALAALHRLTLPGGKLLFADGSYRSRPDDRIREVFGDLPDLATMARLAVDAGFRPRHVAESTLAEWDDFESDWRAGIERLGTPEARAFADQRREEYLTGYRGVVGFGWLVLTPG